MHAEVGHRRDIAFTVACTVLLAVVAGHIWIDELVAFVQWFVTTVVVPNIGVELFF